ncbi:unnamed protein product [Closterium sp. Naga37s-1]|nr:unnamed protein product [Closterium sp. Naga37s-1]
MNAIMVSPARADPPFPVERLPDDVLALVFRSLARTSFRHALVSKRWYRLATSALSHLTIRHRNLSMQEIQDSDHFRNAQLAWLPLPRLLSALRRFPTLTHVSLGEFSIVSADGDALFQCLAATCPFLSHLTVEHQIRMAVTVNGLASLFRGCRKLRELRLLTTDGLPHLPPSLSLLTDLQTLHVCAHPLYGDDSLQELVSPPESIGALQQLRELRIRAGSSFQGLGECVGRLTNLRKLSIGTTHLSRTVTKLPDAIGDLDRLESLEVELDGLECLPESLQLLTGLKTLSLQSNRLQRIPEHVIAGLTQLQSLSLHACDSLGILPESICFLPLSSLSVSSCPSLTSLPHHIDALSQLQTLKLLSLDNFRVPPQSVGNFPQLKTLELDLPALEHLPERFVPICAVVSAANSMEQHPGLFSLTELKVSDCPLIASLPKNFSFPALHTLTLHSLGNREDLLDLTSRQLPQLQRLELEGVGGEADPWLLDCLPGVRSGRTWLLLHVRALFVLLHVVDSLLQLAVLLMRAGCSGLQGACSCVQAMAFVPFSSRLNAMVSPARADPPFPVERLPDDVLALVLRALAQTSFRHALVSKRWLRLATSALSHLTIQHRGPKPDYLTFIEMQTSEHFRNAQLAWLPLPRLLSAMRRFPNLTHVSLSVFSIVSADGDALFQCLAATCPLLSHLTVEHQFRMAVTVDGLALLFHGCRKLREFRLLTTFCLPHLPPSLSLLTDLQTLHVCAHPLYGDDSLQELVSPPESIGALQQLRELRIRAGTSFQGFSRTVTKLPNAIGDLARLETLEIELDGLECIPESFQLLTGLKTLFLQSENLECLPENVMAGLTQLQHLSLHACNALEILPESICFLPLSSLSISSCSSLTSLPHHIGALSHLQTLKLLYLDNIRALPESMGNLPRLKTLEVNLPALKHMPEGLCESSLQACLGKLSLCNCEQLRELPHSLYKLTRLQSLHIESCSHVKSLKPLTPPTPLELYEKVGSSSETESYSLAEKAITAALCTAAVFAAMLLISLPLLTVQELIAPLSTANGIRPPVLLVPAAVLAFAGARSGSAITFVASLLLVVVLLLLISLVPTAWLYPAMLLAAALLVFLFLHTAASASAPAPAFASASSFASPSASASSFASPSFSAPAYLSIPVYDSNTEQHPGLVSLAVLDVINCPLISSLPENFSFPALHTLTLHSLGNLEDHLDFAPRQLPKLRYLDLEGLGGDETDSSLPGCPVRGSAGLLLQALGCHLTAFSACQYRQ